MSDDKRLIEDYLPIVTISAEASRENSVRKRHISTLRLWWARRPLVACRAAVYGAPVPAPRFVPHNGSAVKKKSLGRANAAKFVERLYKYLGDPKAIAEKYGKPHPTARGMTGPTRRRAPGAGRQWVK